MLSLAKTASNYDACIRMSVLGNALGNSIVDASKPRSSSLAALGKQIDEENDRSLNDWAASGLAEVANRIPTLNVELDNNPDDIILGRPTSYGSGTDVYGDGSVITYALPDQPQVGPGVDIPPTIQHASPRPSLEAEIGHALLNGLSALNEATRIPLLGDIKQGARGLLNDFADYSIEQGWPQPLAGGAYALGDAAAQLFLPETGLELIPELGGAVGMLGKAGKLGHTVDDIGVPSSLARIGPAADDIAAKFEPLGITQNPLAFEEGKRLVADLQRTGLSKSEAFIRAQKLFETGSTIPVATPIDQTDRLIKLVPHGNRAPNGSAYWMTESDYRFLQADPANAPGRLGLPADQFTDRYDVYMMRPADSGAVVYQSMIAPTRQGSYLQPGGLRQTLVINPQLFTPPALINTFKWR